MSKYAIQYTYRRGDDYHDEADHDIVADSLFDAAFASFFGMGLDADEDTPADDVNWEQCPLDIEGSTVGACVRHWLDDTANRPFAYWPDDETILTLISVELEDTIECPCCNGSGRITEQPRVTVDVGGRSMGGVLHTAFANVPGIALTVRDFDTDGMTDEELEELTAEVDGDPCIVSDWGEVVVL